MTVLSAATRAGYAADWALFTHWCTAADHQPLPAVADTVVLFLTENPAAVATCARRVTAIAHLHRRYGYPSPTEHPQVKQWLRLAAGLPAEPEPAVPAERVAELLRQIPTIGWPTGLFGRRDRMLLTTRYTAHLTRPQLAALTTEHVFVDPEKLTITLDTAPVVLPATEEPATCPGCGWILWRRMLHLITHHAGPRRMADTLRQALSLVTTDGHRCAAPRDRTFTRPMPVFLPLNRWGATAITPTPISTRSISTLSSAHLTGWAPQHPDLHPPVTKAIEEPAAAVVAPADPRTSAERYLQGLEHRRRDVAELADVGDILDDVDQAAADLDARIKDLVERHGL